MWKIKVLTKTEPVKEKIFQVEAETDLGKQLQALKAEIQSRFQYLADWFNSPQGRLNIICQSLLQTCKSLIKVICHRIRGNHNQLRKPSS